MSETLMIKVEDICIAVDNQLPNLENNARTVILGIHDYITSQNITIIYPNTFVQTYADYHSFFNRLVSAFDKVEILPKQREFIIDYFRKILFDIDLSVIR